MKSCLESENELSLGVGSLENEVCSSKWPHICVELGNKLN